MSDRPLEPSPAPPVALLDVLRRARSLLLVGHERPDGDCLGSQAGLARALRGVGKRVRISNPDAPEPHLAFLLEGLEADVRTGGELPEHELCVLLDASELSRCAGLAEPIARHASRKVVVDHHQHEGPDWWDFAYRDTRAAATGLLVWRLASALGAPIDARAADALLTSLVTDTGWFRFPNTDAETLHVAGRLVELGADPGRLGRAIEGGRAAEHPFALADLLHTTEYFADGRLAVITGSTSPGSSDGANAGDEALAVVRRVGGVEAVLYFHLLSEGRVKLSARSEGDFDARALAGCFGGGGHVQAAGATIAGELAEVRARVTAAALEQLGQRGGRA